ncbi:MAG: glycosyltransferase, partial [Clostridia bacterium]|nr:glycosyltransferase [Clostridia bacterium]
MKRSEKKKLEREYESVVMRKAEEFNDNGKLTVAVFSDAFFPCVDGVVMVVHNVGERLLGDCNYVVFAPRHKGLTVQKNYLVVGCRSGYVKGLNYDVASFFNLGRLFRRTVKRLRIDVIHAHSPFMLGIAALRLHKKTGAPFVMTFHSQYKQDIYKATHSRLLTRIGLGFVMKSFSGADEVWTMHEASAATLKSYGYKGKIRFMPNATDFVYPDDADKRKAIVRKKYGVSGDDKLFLFVGRLVTQKNILIIVEVLRRLKERGLVFRMLYVGYGPDKKKLENKILEEGVEKECVLVGKISDKDLIKDYYLA